MTVPDASLVAVEPTPPAIEVELVDLARRAAGYARNTTADSTRAAYEKDWKTFSAWCRRAGLDALPARPETVGLYLASLAGRLAAATLGRRVAAIATVHRLAGFRLDTRHVAIHDVMSGLRRAHGTAQRRVEPATTGVVQAMAATCGTSLLDLRDRALLLVGFAAALRRSELVALEVADVTIVPEGMRLRIKRSKADQEAAGQIVGVVRTGSASCPVNALTRWLEAAKIENGPVFRRINRHGNLGASLTDQSVALILKRRVGKIGLDPAGFSGHSLRSGLATAAASAGVEERIIARTTRHRNIETLRRYIRDGEIFRENASGRVGL